MIFRNVVDLTEILQQLKREGYLLDPDDLSALSPYKMNHIKRFGDYILDLDSVPSSLDEKMIFTSKS